MNKFRYKFGALVLTMLLVLLPLFTLSGLASAAAPATPATPPASTPADTTEPSGPSDGSAPPPASDGAALPANSSAGASAADMQRSMLKFFREDATTLAVKQTSTDELMVYGVFLSNFLVPGQSTVKDLKGQELAKGISKKFFGSEGNSQTVGELNQVLYDGVAGVFSSAKVNFALKAKANATVALSGEELISKLSGKDPDPKIYNNSGKEVLNFTSTQAGRATLKLLYGMSPDFVLSTSHGLRKTTGLYMDGFGNIWGSYDQGGNPVTTDDYVLVLPAAMNPVVFGGGSLENQKLPLNNVFAMGAIAAIREDLTQNMTNTGAKGFSVLTPYYNLKDMYVAGGVTNTRNLTNFMSIVGIQTPNAIANRTSGSFGDTDFYISNPDKKSTDVRKSVTSFLNQNSQDVFSESQARIMITPDVANIRSAGAKDFFSEKANKGYNDKQLGALYNYFMGTSILSMKDVADDMYYFDVNGGASGGEGSWTGSDTKAFVQKQRMFAKEGDASGAGGGFKFYSNSYSSAPFNKFLRGFLDAGSAGQDKYLQDYLKNQFNKDVKVDAAEFIALKSFLNTGYFSTDKTPVEAATITKALGLLKASNVKGMVYGVTPMATRTDRLNINDGWLLTGVKRPTGYALGPDDYWLGYISLGYTQASLLNAYTEKTTKVFEFNGSMIGKTLGTIKGDTGSKVSAQGQQSIANVFYSSMVYRVFSMNRNFVTALETSGYKGIPYKVAGPLGEYEAQTAVVNGVNNYPGIYWGYMVALLNAKVDAEGNWSSSGFSNTLLPDMPLSTSGGSLDLNATFDDTGVVSSDARDSDAKQKDIIDKIYALLSPEDNSYRNKLVKATQDSWIVQAHRSITSSWADEKTFNVSSGSNGSYASVVGYINTPSLYDMPFTSWVLNEYMYIYMVMMLIMIIVLAGLCLTHLRTLKEGVVIFFAMAFILLLPQFLVTNVISISNSVGDRIFSSKFDYWAIVQYQKFLTDASAAQATGDDDDVLVATTMAKATESFTDDAGVRVKWMAPKKDSVFDSLFSRDQSIQGLQSNLTIFRWLFNSYFDQQEYVFNDPLATYVYRPYSAIAKSGKDLYASLSGVPVNRDQVKEDLESVNTSVLSMPDYRFSTILGNKPMDAPVVAYSDEQKQLIIDSGPFGRTKDDPQADYRFWALANKKVTDSIFRGEFDTDPGLSGDAKDKYTDAYLLTTESPYYYFYNVFKSRYTGVNGSFKSSLLVKDTFRASSDNMEVNNQMRDFLDMEGLFTYVIPYLKQSNDYVYGYTRKYGTSVDGYNFSPNNEPKTGEEKEQFEAAKSRKDNMAKVWKMYTPWVDSIYDLNVYNSNIYAGNKKKHVADAVNPGAYELQGRAMVFSPADMRAKSYNYSDLSPVEQRIQATLESTYTDLMYLTNYYDFDDETLITAAAMMATFNFDREFSQQKLFGESVTLYPQNFELKNFNYDAFMRLMLMNATGEPAQMENAPDLYSRIISKTSIFTGIFLLIADILGVYIIPGIKLLVLVLLLFLCMLFALSAVLTPPTKIFGAALKLIGWPVLLFLGASTLFAYLISTLMGNGLSGYVGSRTFSLGLTDPTLALVAMIVFDGIYLFVLVKLVLFLIRGLLSHTQTSVYALQALGAGVATSAFGGLVAQVKGRVSAFGGSDGSGSGGSGTGGGLGGGSGAGSGLGAGLDMDREQAEARRQRRRRGRYAQATRVAGDEPEFDPAFEAKLNSWSEPKAESGRVKASALAGGASVGALSGAAAAREGKIDTRTVGEKVVDFKYGVKKAGRGTLDRSAGAAKYLTSRDGLYADTKEAGERSVKYVTSQDGLLGDARKAPRVLGERVVNSKAVSRLAAARDGADGYLDGMRAREREHLESTIQEEAKRNPNSARLERDRVRLVNSEEKSIAHRNRVAARRS